MPVARTNAYLSTLVAVLLVAGLSTPASAQDDWIADHVSGIMQLDVTNAYFFRGIKQERHGVQIEPWAELYVNLYKSDDGLLRSASVGGGIWNSFQSERTGAVEYPQWLYETDFYPLVALKFAGGVGLTTTYYFYTSPNGAFNTTQELNFKLNWDDSEAFGKWSMQPWVNFAIETQNTSFGTHSGQGVQMGIAPTLYKTENGSFTLTAPCELGLAIHRYYETASGGENTFGYGNIGLLASFPLKFIPEGAGAWTFSIGGKYYAFSETLENVNDGKSTYPVGTASLSVAF